MRNRKDETMIATWITIFSGIWLLLSPFVLMYADQTPTVNDSMIGLIIGVLALSRILTPIKSLWLGRITILLGFWLILAPFVLGYGSSPARLNDVLLGILLAVVSFWHSNTTAVHHRHRAIA